MQLMAIIIFNLRLSCCWCHICAYNRHRRSFCAR